MGNGLSLALRQTLRGARECRLEIVDGGKMVVSRRDKHSQAHYVVSLVALRPQGRSVWRVGWWWLVAAVIAPLALLATAYFGRDVVPADSQLALALVATGVAAVVCGGLTMAFLASWRRSYVWVTRGAGVPLVEVFAGYPSVLESACFRLELERRIDAAHLHRPLGPSQLVEGELRMLERLHREGVLAVAMLQQARSKLQASDAGVELTERRAA